MNRIKHILSIPLLTVFILQTATTAPAFEVCKISFGVVLVQEAPGSTEFYTALAGYLSIETGVTVDVITLQDVDEFNNKTLDGSIDLLFCYPLQYVRANSDAGYSIVAKLNDEPFRGIIVVRKDSGIEKASALEGKKIAFSHPSDYPAAVLTRETMIERFSLDYYKEMEPLFVGTGKEALMAVYNGKAEAAGATRNELNALDEEIKETLKVILKTPTHAQMPLSVHPLLPDHMVFQVQDSLLTMHETPEGKEALQSAPEGWKGFVDAMNEEYDDARLLMDKLSTPDRPFKEEFYWR